MTHKNIFIHLTLFYLLLHSPWECADMEFVQNFTPLDFQAKNLTPSISPNFNSLSKKNTKNE